MGSVVKATPRRPAFRKHETEGQRAKRMFRDHALSLGRPITPKWEDASKAVRDFWLQAARADQYEAA